MPNLLASIIASAGLGALVGLIRQWSDHQAKENEYVDLGGVRTYTFWGILGCLGAFLSDESSPFLLVAVVVLVGAQQIIAYTKAPGPNRPGGTTFASVMLTLLTGCLVQWHFQQAAVVVTATTMVMLGLKQPLHAWTSAFTTQDIRATLQFVAITGVILPLVPNADFGPYGLFNPFKTWMMVVLISGLGFVGYLAMRLLGANAGIVVTSLLGGLASSTATTLAFSRRSKEDPARSEHYAFAVVIACTVMLARVVVTTSVINRPLALALAPALAAMAVPGIAYGVWLWFVRRPGKGSVATPAIANPLSLLTAIKFALLYAIIAGLVKIITQVDFQAGILPLSFVSGLTDMDAIALSMANSARSGSLALTIAIQAVILAAVANSIVKGIFAVTLGSAVLRRQVAVVLGLTILAGAGWLWMTR